MLKRVMLAGTLLAAIAFAQRGGGGGMGGGMGDDSAGGMGGGRGGDMGMGGAMPRKASKGELFADKLKLNKEQKEEADRILGAALERAIAIRNDLADRRAKIAGAIIDGKSEEEVGKLRADFATVAAEFTKIQADAFAKIWATLKPNQQSKADQAFEVLAGIFNSTQGGGRGRGPGMPGGMSGGMGRRGAGR